MSSTKPRQRAPKYRHWTFTSHNTRNFKLWKSLDLQDLQIRYMVYQLETCPSTGKIHVQGYVEFYQQLRMTQVKVKLGDNALWLDNRKGTRQQARDYCLKDGTPYFDTHYPHWETHGERLPGTDSVELGIFRSKQGHRTDLDQVSDLIKEEASEIEIFENCPSQYLKYSTGIRRARGLMQNARINTYIPNLSVHVIYGDSRAGKTRAVYDRHGPHNVYIPTYSESANKFWFDGYDGQKVLLINEFYGQARTSVMQQLLDHYRIRCETKGGTCVSAWDTIYITSNVHPREWYKGWESIPQKVEESFINRITTIKHLTRPASVGRQKTWEDIPAEAPILPSALPRPEAQPKGPPRVSFAPPGNSPTPGQRNDGPRMQKSGERRQSKVETTETCCRNGSKDRQGGRTDADRQES